MADSAELLRFIQLLGRLKTLRRQGWIDRGVHAPESVAEHSFRLAAMGWVLAQERPDLDASRVAILGLVHDVAEALAGDRTPFDRALAAGFEPAELFRQRPVYDPEYEARKTKAEREAIREMARLVPTSAGSELVAAWEEYEAGETPEARFVRQLDKLETVLQALEYHAQQPELIIDSFVLGALDVVTDPMLRELLERALAEAQWTPSSE
ncbi:MAG: HD domain-containing protein [Thermomicrobium sp.]|nr:HD domain-containing protein [Thermomicrobium sp.]